MARVIADKVRQIIDTNRNDDQLEPFIDTAHILVNELLSNEGYSESLLTKIELWLSAHFIAVRDPKGKSEDRGGVTFTNEGETGLEGLKHTRYGTQVLLLDHHGVLAGAGESKGSTEFRALP